MNFRKLGFVGAMFAAGILGSTLGLAADTATVPVSAEVTGVCKVLTTGAVTFVLDPSVGGTVPGTVTQPTFWCTKGTAWTLSDNKGLNSVASVRKMKSAINPLELISYSFTYATTGSGLGRTISIPTNIAASVLEADYKDSLAGSYADTVTLTISP